MAFRLQRELDIEEKNEERPQHRQERHWFPASDWASAIMLAGYIPSILAHYEFFFGLTRERTNPTFWEGIFLTVTALAAIAAFTLAYRAQG